MGSLTQALVTYVSFLYIATETDSFDQAPPIRLVGASIVKWTKKVLRYTETIIFLVKRL
jgi:hypothetical protein